MKLYRVTVSLRCEALVAADSERAAGKYADDIISNNRYGADVDGVEMIVDPDDIRSQEKSQSVYGTTATALEVVGGGGHCASCLEDFDGEHDDILRCKLCGHAHGNIQELLTARQIEEQRKELEAKWNALALEPKVQP